LQGLSAEERRDLIGYLQSDRQVALPLGSRRRSKCEEAPHLHAVSRDGWHKRASKFNHLVGPDALHLRFDDSYRFGGVVEGDGFGRSLFCTHSRKY